MKSSASRPIRNPLRLGEVINYKQYKRWLASYGHTPEQAIDFLTNNIQISVQALVDPGSDEERIARMKQELDWETQALKEMEAGNDNAHAGQELHQAQARGVLRQDLGGGLGAARAGGN